MISHAVNHRPTAMVCRRLTAGRRVQGITTLLALLLAAPPALAVDPSAGDEAAVAGSAATAQQQCLQGFLSTGSDELTLGEMRARCAVADSPEPAPTRRVDQRIAVERAAASQPFSLLAHKPNYMLLGAWNQRGYDSTRFAEAEGDPNYMLDDTEIQFQLSFKVPLAIDLFDGHVDIYAAYTNRSFWQAYNMDESQPFRETNHEPELWAQFANDWELFGVTNVLNSFGYVHQSNGQGPALSRGWDRLYAKFMFEKEGFVVTVKPWIIINDENDNADGDIEDFMGHGEFHAAWERNDHVLSMMLRNQLESGFDRGATELSWSFPIGDYPYLKGYLQYFYGYGESLIDYDRRVNRIGLGISMTDWLD